MGGFPPKFIMRVGMAQVSVIRRAYLSENRVADPRPSASHVPSGGTEWGAILGKKKKVCKKK